MTDSKRIPLDGITLERLMQKYPGLSAQAIEEIAPHWQILRDMAETLLAGGDDG